jgi:hypothetical protein
LKKNSNSGKVIAKEQKNEFEPNFETKLDIKYKWITKVIRPADCRQKERRNSHSGRSINPLG